VFLWALFVGYATILNNEADVTWIAPLAAGVSVRMRLSGWVDVRDVLRRYGWIHVFYDEFGMKLWRPLEIGNGSRVTSY
jgi:hypothetical protein